MLEKGSAFTIYRKLLNSHVSHTDVANVISKYIKAGITNLPYIMYTEYGERSTTKEVCIDKDGNVYVNNTFHLPLPINLPGLKYFADDIKSDGSIILDDVDVSKLFNILNMCIGSGSDILEYFEKSTLEKTIKDVQLLTGCKDYIPLNVPYNTLRKTKIDHRDISSFAKYKNDILIEESLVELYQILKDYLDLDLLENEDRILVYTEYNR